MEKEVLGFYGFFYDVKKVEGIFFECFRCGKINYFLEKCFYCKVQCYGCQKFGYIVFKCLERCLLKVKGGEIKKSRIKKKRKFGGIYSIEEVEIVVELVDKIVWLMFIVVDFQGRCKELIVLVLIDGKLVDLEFDIGVFVMIILNYFWFGVLVVKFLQ